MQEGTGSVNGIGRCQPGAGAAVGRYDRCDWDTREDYTQAGDPRIMQSAVKYGF